MSFLKDWIGFHRTDTQGRLQSQVLELYDIRLVKKWNWLASVIIQLFCFSNDPHNPENHWKTLEGKKKQLPPQCAKGTPRELDRSLKRSDKLVQKCAELSASWGQSYPYLVPGWHFCPLSQRPDTTWGFFNSSTCLGTHRQLFFFVAKYTFSL